MIQRQKRILELLTENLQILDKANSHLEFSFHKCQKLELKGELSEEVWESWEALASRFARTSDIFTQKVVKALVQLLQENLPTFIDNMNFCEKIGAITSADDLLEIRAIRNSVAHEYRQTNLIELYEKVLDLIPQLNKSIFLTKGYIQDKFPVNPPK